MVAWDDRQNTQEVDSTSASRPLLIFNHNPKAGGGSILSVVRGFKSRELKCNHKPAKAERAGSACKARVWEEAFSEEHGGVDTAFLHFREFARTTHFDRLHGFVIGSIREPCSQYLSLWSWGSLGNGAFRKTVVTNSDLYGVSPPYFNTTFDKNRFLAWMKDPLVVGSVGDRVRDSYGESVLDTVDCWVYVEDFRNSLLGCLQMYADQGGVVDWEAPEVSSLLEQRDITDEEKNHRRRVAIANKNDFLGDPRSKHHGKCENMFDTETAKQVEDNTESFIYKLFGYDGCCKPGTNFYPRGKNAKNNTAIAITSLNPVLPNNESGWQSSPSVMEGYNGHSVDLVVAVATMIGALVIIFCRLFCKPRSE